MRGGLISTGSTCFGQMKLKLISLNQMECSMFGGVDLARDSTTTVKHGGGDDIYRWFCGWTFAFPLILTEKDESLPNSTSLAEEETQQDN